MPVTVNEFKLNNLDGSITTEYSDGSVVSGNLLPASTLTAEDVARVRAGATADSVNPDTGGTIPTKTVSGRAITYRSNGAPVVYSGGFLTSGAGVGTRAWYAEFPVPEGISRIGAEFSFAAGSGGKNGAIAIIPWRGSVTAAAQTPPTSLHFVLTRFGWRVDKISTVNGSVVNIATGSYKANLSTGVTYRAEAVIDDGKAYLVLPDGTTAVVADAVLLTLGTYAGWEFYQFDGATDDLVSIRRVWAMYGDQASAGIGSMLAASLDMPRKPSGISLSSVASSSIPTAEADFDAAAVCDLYPGKGNANVAYTIKVWVNLAAGRSYILAPKFVDADGATITGPSHFALTAPAGGYSGWVNFSDVQAVASSKPVKCVLRHWSTGAGDTVTVAANKTFAMTFTPLG